MVSRAWYEFAQAQGIDEEVIPVPEPDKHGAWFKKTKEVVLDHSKRPPPMDEEVKRV